MLKAMNTKKLYMALIGLITILLIISTAQARNDDRGSRSNDRDQSAVAPQKDVTPARAAPREGRSSDVRAVKQQPVDKAQVRSERPDVTARDQDNTANKRSARVERNVEQQTIAPQERANTGAPENEVNPQPAPQARQRVIAQPVTRSVEKSQPRSEQPTASAPAVKSQPAEQVKREAIAQPITQSIERSRPRVELPRAAAPVVKSPPVVDKDTKQERKRIVAPIAKTAEPAKISKTPVRTDKKAVAKSTANTNSTKIEKAQSTDQSRIADRAGQNNRIAQKAAAPATIQKAAPQTVSSPIAKSSTEQTARQRGEKRERIVRGTAGNEVAVPNTGRLKNAEKAVTAVDARSGRTVIKNNRTVINNKTVVKDFDGRRDHDYGDRRYDRDGHYDRDRHYNHDGGWWNRHDDHHSSVFLSFGFSSGYYCSPWSPIVYEPVYASVWDPFITYQPACVTPVAYSTVSYSGNYRPIVYNHGHHRNVSYVYPGYHRRYVFVSVGGFWPDYPYARYYWYGYHPWYWYGAAPVAYPIGGGDTYNYYTYDNNGNGSNGEPLTPGTVVNGVEVPDYDGLHAAGGRQIDVPAQMPEQLPSQMPPLPQPEKPAVPTESDKLFDEAVKAFGDANYAAATEKFQRAVRLEPNDVILPFAYTQALFANNNYEQAAAVLHTALNSMAPAKPEVFFPRGLYKDDNVLTNQIKNLEKAVLMNPSNPELQLLYGYQLLGIGRLDEAKVPLEVAKRDARTTGPATSLLNLLEQIKQDSK